MLKELLVFLSDHFSLSTYLRALLSSRQVCFPVCISSVPFSAGALVRKPPLSTSITITSQPQNVSRYDAQARRLQNAGDNGSSSGSHISRPWCEPPQEKQAWEQPNQEQEEDRERTEMAQRKVKGKCKVKTQKDKDAEKVRLHMRTNGMCPYLWCAPPASM